MLVQLFVNASQKHSYKNKHWRRILYWVAKIVTYNPHNFQNKQKKGFKLWFFRFLPFLVATLIKVVKHLFQSLPRLFLILPSEWGITKQILYVPSFGGAGGGGGGGWLGGERCSPGLILKLSHLCKGSSYHYNALRDYGWKYVRK